LKRFRADISDKHLAKLKNIIALLLLDKAYTAWDEKGYTDEKLQQILDKE
jgi:hypothetical protein